MLRHDTDWTLTRLPGGSYEWKIRTGHRYRYRPPRHPTPTAHRDIEAEPAVHDPDLPPFRTARPTLFGKRVRPDRLASF
jgi:hypothetical protein